MGSWVQRFGSKHGWLHACGPEVRQSKMAGPCGKTNLLSGQSQKGKALPPKLSPPHSPIAMLPSRANISYLICGDTSHSKTRSHTLSICGPNTQSLWSSFLQERSQVQRSPHQLTEPWLSLFARPSPSLGKISYAQ